MSFRETTVDVITIEILLPREEAAPGVPRDPEQRMLDAVEALHHILPPELEYWSVQEAHVEQRPLLVGFYGVSGSGRLPDRRA